MKLFLFWAVYSEDSVCRSPSVPNTSQDFVSLFSLRNPPSAQQIWQTEESACCKHAISLSCEILIRFGWATRALKLPFSFSAGGRAASCHGHKDQSTLLQRKTETVLPATAASDSGYGYLPSFPWRGLRRLSKRPAISWSSPQTQTWHKPKPISTGKKGGSEAGQTGFSQKVQQAK